MPNDQRQDDNSNEDYSVRVAANHRDSGPGRIHGPISCHSPSAVSLTTNAVPPGGTSSSSSSNRKRSHHQKHNPKRTRSVSKTSLSLVTLSIHSDLANTSSSNSEPSSRQRTFSRTQASSTLTNISNVPTLTPTTNGPLPHPPQFTFVPVQSDVTTWGSNVTAAEELDPFSTCPPLPPHLNSVMFPSLTSIDDVLEDNSFKGIQLEIDALGCAILPPSEYALSIESECKFHYSFWDSYNRIHFCVPVDLALHLDPSRASLFDYYPLALPPISQVAVRFSTVTIQTRFSRLVPKPLVNTLPIIQPNQSYRIAYRGAVLKCPNPPHKKVEKDMSEITIAKGIFLSSSWERIVDVDDDLCPTCPSPRSKLPRGKEADQTSQEYQDLRKGRKTGVGEGAEGEEEHQQEGKRGFSIRAWIPVPVSLFVNKETCTFRVEARVAIENPFSLRDSYANGDGVRRFKRHGVRWDVGVFDDEPRPPKAVCTGRMLEASAEVTVSHLHSMKEMV